MAFMSVFCSCAGCRRPIHINPNRCPSIIIAGQREPLCPECVTLWNELHPDQPDVIPHPDAYEPEEVA